MAIRSIFLFAIIAFGSLSALAQKDGDPVALKAVIDRMTAAQTAYDASTLDRVFTADFIEISPVGEYDPAKRYSRFTRRKKRPVVEV